MFLHARTRARTPRWPPLRYAGDLLDTHVTDYAAGQAFFGERYRLHEDALADSATAYLDTLFPPVAGGGGGECAHSH